MKRLMVVVLLAVMVMSTTALAENSDDVLQALEGTWVSAKESFDGGIFSIPSTITIPSEEVSIFSNPAGEIKLTVGENGFALADVYVSADGNLLLIILGNKAEIFQRSK